MIARNKHDEGKPITCRRGGIRYTVVILEEPCKEDSRHLGGRSWKHGGCWPRETGDTALRIFVTNSTRGNLESSTPEFQFKKPLGTCPSRRGHKFSSFHLSKRRPFLPMTKLCLGFLNPIGDRPNAMHFSGYLGVRSRLTSGELVSNKSLQMMQSGRGFKRRRHPFPRLPPARYPGGPANFLVGSRWVPFRTSHYLY
ncbi:hypothetical protein AVEN_36493-1 [Araneus ventricosus]|uniref:Uncharacterized protein n=1 Tax=Araneus ventricosus TaxID=182803 RepID=A0A4Y2QZI3_ARAVE|nr:hypothetical protein AVEN_36493-1 [Araneus ventricosus]